MANKISDIQYKDKKTEYKNIFENILKIYDNIEKSQMELTSEFRTSNVAKRMLKNKNLTNTEEEKEFLTKSVTSSNEMLEVKSWFLVYIDDSYVNRKRIEISSIVALIVCMFFLPTFAILFVYWSTDFSLLFSFSLLWPVYIGFLPAYIVSLAFLIPSIKQKKETISALVECIEFTEENKQMLSILMRDDKRLWNIYQYKYGKNKFILRSLGVSFYNISEKGEIWIYPKYLFKASFVLDMIMILPFIAFFFVTIFYEPIREVVPVLVLAVLVFIWAIAVLFSWIYSYFTVFIKYPFKPERNIKEEIGTTSNLENKNRSERIK